MIRHNSIAVLLFAITCIKLPKQQIKPELEIKQGRVERNLAIRDESGGKVNSNRPKN